MCYLTSSSIAVATTSADLTASLDWWLRRPPRERQTWVRFPISPCIVFPGPIIPVTSELVLLCVPGSALGLAGLVSVCNEWVEIESLICNVLSLAVSFGVCPLHIDTHVCICPCLFVF